jgi:hypothetical protein
MDIRKNGGHRPQQKTASAPVNVSYQENMNGYSNRPHRNAKLTIICGVIVALLLLLAAAVFFWSGKASNDKSINRDGYQAVFLSNSQVYFGKLEQASAGSVVLRDVYYLQVQQPVQPQKDDAVQPTSQQASLSKLGGEVHGPEDTMFINSEHLLFWENLKDDSKVVQAIKENQKK